VGVGRDVAELRRAVLAVAVLEDVDLDPGRDGVTVPGPSGAARVVVGWDRVAVAVGALAPESALARLRTATLLRTDSLLAEVGDDPAWAGRHVRALALPAGHAVHPGAGWPLDTVLGGVLEVGLGLVDVPWPAEGVVPLPPGAARPAGWWAMARDHARRMGALAGARVGTRGDAVLRPVGGCDVLSLLATRALRTVLAATDGSGMRAVAVPTRTRGWYDLARIDPAFAGAVWSATEDPARGVPRPLLVTRDEVVLVREGGTPAQALDLPRDPGREQPVEPSPAARPRRGRHRAPGPTDG
jgi:hypothetical protein